MPAVPSVRSSAQAIYPVTKFIVFDTGVAYSSDGSEQRYKRRAPLFRFQLDYSSLPPADVASVVSFFAGQKGQFGNSASLTLGATTFSDLALESDSIDFSEPRPGLYDLTMSLRQVKNRAYSIPGVTAAYPTITGSIYTQRPYKPRWRSLTSFNDSPTGFRYSYAWWNGGLSGLPSGQLRGWEYNYPDLSDTDLGTLETFFVGMQGRLTTFSVVDPETAASYTNCRFDTDVMQIKYIGPNHNSVSLQIIETNG